MVTMNVDDSSLQVDSQCKSSCSTSDHRDPDIWAWSVTADALQAALAGYSWV